MKIKICTPVIGKTLSEFLKNLIQVQEISDMVELRVDEIKNLTGKDLRLIKGKTKKEAILTSRKKEIILKAFEIGFDYVDVDLEILEKEPAFTKAIVGKETKIILSFHDFKKTPNLKKLELIVDNMRKFKIRAIKIATKVNKDQDIKNLLQILLNRKKNEKIIIIGMGKKGQITRILGPLLGSFLTFASTKFGKTAPGQIDILELKKSYKLIS